MLKGFVTLDGPKICKAEMQIHLPLWSKNSTVLLCLDPSSTVSLPQITHCHTLIELALESLALVQYNSQARSAIAGLADAIRYCNEAVRALDNPGDAFPMTHATMVGAPDDLAVCFGVQNARIVAIVYLISATSTSSLSLPTARTPSRIPSLFTSSHPLASASSDTLVRVDSVVPALTIVHEVLTHCIAELASLWGELGKVLSLYPHD